MEYKFNISMNSLCLTMRGLGVTEEVSSDYKRMNKTKNYGYVNFLKKILILC